MYRKQHDFERTFAVGFVAESVTKTEIAYTIVTAVCVRTCAINTTIVRANSTLVYV